MFYLTISPLFHESIQPVLATTIGRYFVQHLICPVPSLPVEVARGKNEWRVGVQGGGRGGYGEGG